MTTPTDADPTLLTVIARMKAAPGKEDELRSVLSSVAERTTQEEGCINYDLHEDLDTPGVFCFYENWKSADHLDAHLAAPHLAEFIGKMGDLLDESGLTMTKLRRIA